MAALHDCCTLYRTFAVTGVGHRTATVEEFNATEIEQLSEAEHDRWNAEKVQNQSRRVI